MSELLSIGCETLNLYLDGELDTVASLAFERHLESCASCTQDLAAFRALRSRLQNELTRRPASDALRRNILAALPVATVATSTRRREWPRLAAAAAIIAVLSSGMTFTLLQPSDDDLWVDGIVLAHERAMLAGHEIDVVSSNRHTVKPWFSGKTTIAPLVVDLADAGYPLIGGRLDVPLDKAMPAIVYGAGPHTISLYMRPAEGESAPSLRKRDGFSVLEWRQNGFAFTAVSDADGNEVRGFQKAFAVRAAAMP